MTQKLQQSIQVLQFSSDELLAFVDNQALENPLIDLTDHEYPTSYTQAVGHLSNSMNI